jgi:hypothetical protein
MTKARETQMAETRKTRDDLTQAEKERLEKYGSISFRSAGATRKR